MFSPLNKQLVLFTTLETTYFQIFLYGVKKDSALVKFVSSFSFYFSDVTCLFITFLYSFYTQDH